MDGVAVVLVQHVVQVPGEDPEGRLGQGPRHGVRVGDGHDRVGSAVDEEHRQRGAGLGESGGDLRPHGPDREQRLPPEPTLPGQWVVQEGVHVPRVAAHPLGRIAHLGFGGAGRELRVDPFLGEQRSTGEHERVEELR